MARIINQDKTKIQKDRITDTAVKMFIKKGYEKTSLNDIIAKLGIAKGTFYHYFPSKEEMLNYLINQMSEDMLPEVEKIVAKSELDALTKLNKVVRVIKRYKITKRKLVKLLAKEMYREENLVLRHKITEHTMGHYVPAFAQIIKQGKKEGVFHLSDPEETAELFMRLSISLGDAIAPIMLNQKLSIKNLKLFRSKVKVYKEAMRRILGMKQGDIDIYDEVSLKKILE